MSLYTVKPLDDYTIFTTPRDRRKPVQFKAKWSTTVADLRRELEHLEAEDVVLEIAVQPRHVRVDGQLRADVPKNLPHPGVRLSFRSKHGPLTFTCDTYEARYYGQMADWEANLRAIVLSLEALRAVDRYGALKGEQYVGSRALPPGAGATPLGGMTPEAAYEVLVEYATEAVGDRWRGESTERVYRWARAHVHPDRRDGDQSAWDKVEEAARVLGVAR